MTKQDIRNEIKARIAAISKEELRAQSDALCKTILESKDFIRCTTLLAYMPLPDEADITAVIQQALEKEKKVFLPHVTPGTSQMEFYRCSSTQETHEGEFGIKEPETEPSQSFKKFLEYLSIQQYSPAAHSSDYVDIEEREQPIEHILVLVPGRAFTKGGKRIGRGKGFYDIYFSQIPLVFDIKKSGVCLGCQLFADLPTTPDDILMDSVVCGDFDTTLRGTQSPQ